MCSVARFHCIGSYRCAKKAQKWTKWNAWIYFKFRRARIDVCCLGVSAYLLFVKNRWKEKKKKRNQNILISWKFQPHIARHRIQLSTDEYILKAHKRWTQNLFTICTHEQQHALQITTRHTYLELMDYIAYSILDSAHTALHDAARFAIVCGIKFARSDKYFWVVCYKDVCIVNCLALPEPIVSRWTPFFCLGSLLTIFTDLPRVCVCVLFSLFTFRFLAMASDCQERRQGPGERRLRSR